MGVLRKVAPVVVVGMGLVMLGEQSLQRWMAPAPPARLDLGTLDAPRTGECLDKPRALALLAARGARARADTPPFCAEPGGLTEWLAITGAEGEAEWLAFDVNGCLSAWTEVPCP